MTYNDIADRDDRRFIAVCRQFITNFQPAKYAAIFKTRYKDHSHPNKAINEARRAVNQAILRDAQAGGLIGSWRDYAPKYGREVKRVIPEKPPVMR